MVNDLWARRAPSTDVGRFGDWWRQPELHFTRMSSLQGLIVRTDGGVIKAAAFVLFLQPGKFICNSGLISPPLRQSRRGCSRTLGCFNSLHLHRSNVWVAAAAALVAPSWKLWLAGKCRSFCTFTLAWLRLSSSVWSYLPPAVISRELRLSQKTRLV